MKQSLDYHRYVCRTVRRIDWDLWTNRDSETVWECWDLRSWWDWCSYLGHAPALAPTVQELERGHVTHCWDWLVWVHAWDHTSPGTGTGTGPHLGRIPNQASTRVNSEKNYIWNNVNCIKLLKLFRLFSVLTLNSTWASSASLLSPTSSPSLHILYNIPILTSPPPSKTRSPYNFNIWILTTSNIFNFYQKLNFEMQLKKILTHKPKTSYLAQIVYSSTSSHPIPSARSPAP